MYLAALAMRAAPDAALAASRLTGDDPYIVEYFRDELLARESPETVRFLMRTAVLDQMSGPLCDHVLGRGGSAGLLAEAARRNLFVVPLDRRGEWYRYHRLVAEMLLSELRRHEPGEEPRVHRRAADWYEKRAPREGHRARARRPGHPRCGPPGQPARAGLRRRRSFSYGTGLGCRWSAGSASRRRNALPGRGLRAFVISGNLGLPDTLARYDLPPAQIERYVADFIAEVSGA